MSVVIETNVGDITIDLYVEERPKSCLNFLKLCKMKAFHFNLFHFVQRNFVIQTGDPTGTGRGGESIFKHIYGEQASFVDGEKTPRIKHKRRGTVSFVNNGSDQIGSQFFITAGPGPQPSLDAGGPHGHTGHVVFGEVVDGFDVVDSINEAYCDPQGRPFKDIRIFHTVVVDDPFDDPEGLSFPGSSPPITAEAIASDRLGVDDDPMDEEGLDESAVNEKFEEKEAKARATVLELVGDISHVDDAPPENVLFVCKLNPVTTEEDLQIIFSRFGKINACDIITDKRTGASLQYAFVEFDKPEECERAYFKMDNVLIDDRRIHVDFSQSVAKNQWQQLRDEKRRKKGGGHGGGGVGDETGGKGGRGDVGGERNGTERKKPLYIVPTKHLEKTRRDNDNSMADGASKPKIPRLGERDGDWERRNGGGGRGGGRNGMEERRNDLREEWKGDKGGRGRSDSRSPKREERKELSPRRDGSGGARNDERRNENERREGKKNGDRRYSPPRDRSEDKRKHNDSRDRRSPDRNNRRSPDRNRLSPDRNRRSPDRNRRSPDRNRPNQDRNRHSPDRNRRSPDRIQPRNGVRSRSRDRSHRQDFSSSSSRYRENINDSRHRRDHRDRDRDDDDDDEEERISPARAGPSLTTKEAAAKRKGGESSSDDDSDAAAKKKKKKKKEKKKKEKKSKKEKKKEKTGRKRHSDSS